MKNTQEKFDVAVIGAGPAGLVAAGRAAELGASVAIFDKNKNFGRKLLLTGNGRCNLTQAEFNDREFVKKLDKKGQWLFSALAAFGPQEVINFFESRGLKTKIETGQRVFPVSDRAQGVLDLRENKVKVFLGEEVLGLSIKDKKITSVKLGSRSIEADSFILCTGGKAYATTGSTGDGYKWAQDLGHKIIKTFPALVPVETKEVWPKNLPGVSLKNIQLNLWQGNKKQDFRLGDMLFTHFGLSGPAVLDLSKKIGELLPAGEVMLEIDLFPDLDAAGADKKLQRGFAANSNRELKNYLAGLMPQKMTETVVGFSKINPHKKLSEITCQERKKLAGVLKSLRAGVRGLMGFDQAMVTTGGVDLKEIDSQTMKSKIIENLFFAGEVVDLEGPTGGYNLQICWSTGYLAGSGAGSRVK